MIFELLDAKRQRITTVTDKNLVDGSIRRELDDRFVKESLDVEFTLKMKDELDNARFLMVSDTGYLRGNPVFRIYQKQVRDTIQVVATSYTTEDLGGYLVNLDGLFISEGNPVDLIKAEFNKVGYDLMLDGVTITEDDLQLLDYQLPDGEVGIGRVLEELMLILDVYGEFVFTAEKDEVVKVGIRLAKQLGRTVKRGLIYGVNITDLRVEERVEDIITAVEYTGEETVNTAGEVVDTLTLQGARATTLPKTKRRVEVEKYVDENGIERFILEDRRATQQYGTYNFDTGEMRPIIESYSDVYINNRDDLLQEAIVKLDGNSVPKTQYNIGANVSGLDVGDVVEVQIPHLKIDRFLDVLSVRYTFNREGRVIVTVGEHIATELERRFDEIGVDNKAEVGGLPVDTKRGETVADVIPSQTIQYETGYGLALNTRTRARFVKSLNTNMYPHLYDYYLSFDYKINNGYSGGFFELALTYYDNPTYTRYLRENTFPADNAGCVVNVGLEGQSGSIDVRMNDYTQFMRAYELSGITTRNNGEEDFYIHERNNVLPLVAVYDGTGTAYYLNYLGRNVEYPATTKEELDMLPGYITNFKITQHKRTTRDRDGDYSMYKTSEVEQLTLALDFENNGKDLM